jgi:hypothetical protein
MAEQTGFEPACCDLWSKISALMAQGWRAKVRRSREKPAAENENGTGSTLPGLWVTAKIARLLALLERQKPRRTSC